MPWPQAFKKMQLCQGQAHPGSPEPSAAPLQVINVTPRYARLKAADKKQVIGWENIELISDRPLKTMLQEFRQLKAEYPKR